ncbi:MAG TPA: dihydrofolate reductase [Candidatus Nanoarchaeia archaeon]|nr:dihydrofolate reductase [Candidatus Nanoarchaeia archaeon]
MISLIAAVAQNRVIGMEGHLPWSIPEDFKRFKQVTRGNPIIMGSSTFLSLPKRPLPERKNIVVTRNPDRFADYISQGVLFVHSPRIGLEFAKTYGENVYVIGGQQIYEQTIELADRLDITEVKLSPSGDAFFPEIDLNVWRESKREDHGSYAFVEYLRK